MFSQGWGQFNSGIGIAAQFQFQFRNWNWNWNWWNWKWNWNWKPWNWNWKLELIFLQLLPQQLLVNQPFQNFSFDRGGHNLSCDWLIMKQVFLGHCPPVVWSQKTHGQGIFFPLSGQRPEGLKMVTINISLSPWYKQNYYHCWMSEWFQGLGWNYSNNQVSVSFYWLVWMVSSDLFMIILGTLLINLMGFEILELELELKSPELELELKLILSSGIGIGIENIGIGIELKKWNWTQPCV